MSCMRHEPIRALEFCMESNEKFDDGDRIESGARHELSLFCGKHREF
jgi:hypothetical protein